MANVTTLLNYDVDTAQLGVSGKTISNVSIYNSGSVAVVELDWSDGTTSYIKAKQTQFEVNGTNDWGTGTVLYQV